MTVNPWSSEDTVIAQTMNESGAPNEEIARRLGRSRKAVNARLAWLRLPQEKKDYRAARKRKYEKDNYVGRNAKKTGFFTPSARPAEDVIVERDRRLALQPRDLTALLFGDPLPGYSALERRA